MKTDTRNTDALQQLLDACGKTYPKTAPLSLKKENACELSIIIPVYNMGDFPGYRGQLLNRCMLQTIAPLYFSVDFSCEIIFVDDGSSDDTAEVLQGYKDDPHNGKAPHLTDFKIIHQEHLGVAAARNTGLRNAGGKYVIFIDADDEMVNNDGFKILYDLAEQYDADICTGKRRHWFPPAYDFPAYPEATQEINILTKYEEFRKVSGYITGKLIRRELFDQTAFPEGLIYEDTLTQLVLYPRCRRMVCTENPRAVYMYEVHTGGITYSKNVGELGADAVMAALECVRSLSELRKKTDLPRPDIWWYHTVVNHLGSLLYHRTIHCSSETRKCVFRLACKVADLAAREAGFSSLRPVSMADFVLYHHLYHQWIVSGQTAMLKDRYRPAKKDSSGVLHYV